MKNNDANDAIIILIFLIAYLLLGPIWHSTKNYNDRSQSNVIRKESTRFGIFNWMELGEVTFVLQKEDKQSMTKPADKISLSGSIATAIAFMGLFVFTMIFEKKNRNSNQSPSGNPAPPSS